MKEMQKGVFKAVTTVAVFSVANLPALAAGGGRLAATQAINGLGAEFSGPLAYGLSLIAIVGTAISWFRHHHDMGAISQGAMGGVFVGGVALGGASLLGMIPGVGGALI